MLEVLCCRHGWWCEHPGCEEPGVSLERPEDQICCQECCPLSPLGKKAGTRKLRAALLNASGGQCRAAPQGGKEVAGEISYLRSLCLLKICFHLLLEKNKSHPKRKFVI